MSVSLISVYPLEENYAEFENNEVGDQDLGAIAWADPVKIGGIYKVTFSGLDVSGETIPNTTIEIDESETINPTKVFWWIIKKALPLICPSCNNGY